MGIDYYTCTKCERNFPDCIDFYTCEECENLFCSRKCADLKIIELNDSEDNIDDEDELDNEEYYEDKYNCCICRKEEANDYILLNALLRYYNITRDDAMKIWREEKIS